MKTNIIVFSIIVSLLILKELIGLDNIKNNNLFKQISLSLQNLLIQFNLTEDNLSDEDDLTASEDTLNIVNTLYEKNIKNVYLDIKINNIIERIEIELFNDIVPKTTKNFYDLCKNKAYKNNKFHRLVKDFCLQGGDVTNNDGTGGISIYGNTFDDENFDIKHTTRGLLSMANKGPNTNNSQFFITLNKAEWLDNKHVVFGRIISNLNILNNINILNTINEKPEKDIIIVDCGVL
tara:strand:- start:57 stop:761 length:705 start_codon:yes stop_codon:yes gene_type:complete